ncbi:MAG TPA: hypothetical protein EYQ73_01045 [Candidatus Poseidoniales archaeon]|nr:hypothetical protein [Candidatus Poseidoniales archaeon]
MDRPRLAIFLVVMFSAMSFAPMANATVVAVGQSIDVVIGSGPNGISRDFELEIPDSEVLTNLNLTIDPVIWPSDDVLTFESKTDFEDAQAIMDGVDLNQSGLRILPMGYEWDFEGSSQSWTFGGGGWAHGYDSTLGSTNGVHSGTSAIYTYNGNYPNYMGTTYYATSPIVDCTSCQGSWDLKYWKRLGVESASYDHAYVAVKSSSGSWTNVYSSPYGSTNDGSFTQQTHDISNYISGNSQFQIRFGLGRTDGSVTYTGWNVDDVLLEPRGNTGTGTANWTSPAFTQRGLMAIDAEVPSSALFKWSILDADTGTFVPGFQDRSDLSVDLSAIPKSLGQLRLDINMETTSYSPIVHSIKIGGGIIEAFHEDPTAHGWMGHSGFSSTSGASGTSDFQSPEWVSSTPFSRIDTSLSYTGTGDLQASFDDGQYIAIPENGLYSLSKPATKIAIKFVSTQSWTIDQLSLDLHKNIYPKNTRLDIGVDGTNELMFDYPLSNQTWLYQSQFTNGESMNLSTSSQSGDILLIPVQHGQLDGFNFFVSAPFARLDNVSVTLSSGTSSFQLDLGMVSEPQLVRLNAEQLETIFSAQAGNSFPATSSANQKYTEVSMEVTSSNGGDIYLTGYSSYLWQGTSTGDSDGAILRSINSELPDAPLSNGTRTISIPMVLDSAGRISIGLVDLSSIGSPEPISMTMSNQTDTLVAGLDWYEFTSTFDLGPMGISDARSHILSEGWSSRFDIDGSLVSTGANCQLTIGTCNEALGMTISNHSATFNGSEVEFFYSVQIDSSLASEQSLKVSSSIQMSNAVSQPATMNFGLGFDMGLEQDVEVVDWNIISASGIKTPWDALYYDPNIPGMVDVELKFKNLDDVPRSGAFTFNLILDGVVVSTTDVINNGIASLNYTPFPTAPSMVLELQITSVYGGNIIWKVAKNGTFLPDDKGPLLLSSSVNFLDHRPLDQPLDIVFNIGDRPVLPQHAVAHLYPSWSQPIQVDLVLPDDFNTYQGDYLLLFDISQASIGDTLSGWLEVADPAGHLMPDAGSSNDPLFTIKFGPDGAPEVLADGLGWQHSGTWLHPDQEYSLLIPLKDVNGYGDISAVEIDLAADSTENLLIDWDPIDGCTSSDSTLILNDCSILAEEGGFAEMFILQVNISLRWSFNPDSSIERWVRITARDNAGQSHRLELESDSWSFSGELEIDANTVAFSDSNVFVSPGSIAILEADVIWSKSNVPVDFSVDILAAIGNDSQYGVSSNGRLSMSLIAPNQSGIYPISLDLANLPIGVIDRTDDQAVVAWMIVDSNAPRITQLLSPSAENVIEERDWENLRFEFMIDEPEGLDVESLRLHWILMPEGRTLTELSFIGGNVTMELIAGTGSGGSIPVEGIIDLESILPNSSRDLGWDLWIWVSGQDNAGQQIDDRFNNKESPIAVLQLEKRRAKLSIDSDDIELLNRHPEIFDTLWLNITVHNSGSVDASTSVRIEAVESGGNRVLLEVVNIIVGGENSTTFKIKWIPENEGAAWIEVSTPEGLEARTDPIQIDEGASTYVVGGFEGVDNAMLTGFGIITGVLILLLGFLIITGPKKDRKYDDEDYY